MTQPEYAALTRIVLFVGITTSVLRAISTFRLSPARVFFWQLVAPTQPPEPATGGRTNTERVFLASMSTGVAREPGDGKVHLATSQGLSRCNPSGRSGSRLVIDIMGFSIAGAEPLYAPGHPGSG